MSLKVLITGAGPAGCACAIMLRQAGFPVTILEQHKFPRQAPGETLHPGIEPLLTQLGVMPQILAQAYPRHLGIITTQQHQGVFTPYHSSGDWRGFQCARDSFDQILLNRAIESGADVLTETRAQRCHRASNGKITGIATRDKLLTADYYIDATGSRAWLAHALNTDYQYEAQKRIAYYGYARPLQTRPIPEMIWDKTGWTWLAHIKPDVISWVRLNTDANERLDKNWLPAELKGAKPLATRRARDVSWRMANLISDTNYSLIGDAACVLDPASSQGVLKAIMSGIMVAHLLSARNSNQALPHHRIYQQWLTDWFQADIAAMKKLYRSMARQVD